MNKIVMLMLSVFLFLFISTGYAQDMSPEAGKLYNAGNKLLKEGNYNGAIENYNNALAIEKDYRMFYQRGVAQKKTRNLEDAKYSFEECLNLNKDFLNAYNALGGVYFQMRDFTEAIKNFEKVLELTDKDKIVKKVEKNLSLAYTKLGDQALSDGNANKGIDYLVKSVGYNNYDAAYLKLAKIYSEIGEWDKSISASYDALQYRSKISKGGPYFYMGVSYKGKGENDKAIEMFNKAKGDATYKKTAEYELSLLN